MDPCPCPLGVSQGLGGGEVEDVDGIALGVVARVFEGELVVGESVVGVRLHQAVDKYRRDTLAIDGLGEGDFACEVDAVDGENGGRGESNLFLGGHDLAIGERKADDGLGGGASACGVAGVDTCDGQGGLTDLDGGAFLGDSGHIFATLGISAGDGLECAAHGVAYGIVDFLIR